MTPNEQAILAAVAPMMDTFKLAIAEARDAGATAEDIQMLIDTAADRGLASGGSTEAIELMRRELRYAARPPHEAPAMLQ